VSVLQLFVSTGYVVYAKREMLVNFYTNTIFDECQSAGGLPSTVIAQQEMNVFMPTQKNVGSNVPIITEDFVNLVRSIVAS
jgi:hypothetical protein